MNSIKNRILALGIIFILFFSFSCEKPKTFPNTPQITYLDFVKYQYVYGTDAGGDSVGILKFNFADGNGDIGLNPWDTVAPFTGTFYNDFFAIQSEYINGVWVPDTYKFNERIPFLTPEGSSNALQGEIDISWALLNPLKLVDTVRWEFWICDRGLNLSNHLTTPEIIVNR